MQIEVGLEARGTLLGHTDPAATVGTAEVGSRTVHSQQGLQAPQAEGVRARQQLGRAEDVQTQVTGERASPVLVVHLRRVLLRLDGGGGHGGGGGDGLVGLSAFYVSASR